MADPAARPLAAPGPALSAAALAPAGPEGERGAAWAAQAIANPRALLSDHAHCERKAAATAMALLAAHPELPHLVAPLAALAAEEMRHLAGVHRLLVRRGEAWAADGGCRYAQQLGAGLRHGRRDRLVDRLLVAALIEARSCERLARLGEAFSGSDVGALWAALARSEAGHFRLFLRLAARALPDRGVRERRLFELARLEGEVCRTTVGPPRVL